MLSEYMKKNSKPERPKTLCLRTYSDVNTKYFRRTWLRKFKE